MNNSRDGDEHTGPFWWVGSVLTWALLFAMLTLLAVTILIPAVAGGERFTVLTGSMDPTYPPGTLIVVVPVEPDELAVGMPVTYQLRSGEPTVVTHRIVASTQSAKGKRTYITRGDANDVPDEDPIVHEQIRGRVWYSIPYLGYVNNWLTGQQRSWTIGIIATVLFAYAATLFAGGIRDGRRERAERTSRGDHAHRR